MIGHCGVVACQRRSVSACGSSTTVPRPRSAWSAPSMTKTRLQTISPGRLTPLIVPPPSPKYTGGWRSLTAPGVAADEVRRRHGAGDLEDPHEVVAVLRAPAHVVQRGRRIEAQRRPDAVRDERVDRGALVDLVEVRDRPARVQLARRRRAARTGGRSASLSSPSARSDAGAMSLRPCWYWMPIASQPNWSAMRIAAMYRRSWSSTWSSVSSVAPSLPEAELMPRPRQPAVGGARLAVVTQAHLRDERGLAEALLVDARWG